MPLHSYVTGHSDTVFVADIHPFCSNPLFFVSCNFLTMSRSKPFVIKRNSISHPPEHTEVLEHGYAIGHIDRGLVLKKIKLYIHFVFISCSLSQPRESLPSALGPQVTGRGVGE